MLTSSIEPTEVELSGVELSGVSSGTGLRQRRGKSAAASAAYEEEDEEDKVHTSFLPSSSTSAASVRPSSSTSAASVLPSSSTSAASAGPLTASVRPAASAAAPVGESIRLDEPGLMKIIEENNTPVPNNVSAKFTYFTVGEGGRYGKAPPENLESDQIIEYNLLQKPEDQRKREYEFLKKQQLVLKHNLDKRVPEYDKKLEKYLKPNLITGFFTDYVFRQSLQDSLFYDDLVKEEIPTRRPDLHNLKTTIERYKKLFEQVEANLFVHETIREGKTVSDVYITRFGIKKGGRRTIRRKRSKPAKTYKKHGSYRRRHGKTKTRRS